MSVRAESYAQLREKSILFADDEWGRIADERPAYNSIDNGVEFKPFLIVPSPHLVKTYPELSKPTTKWIHTPLGDAIWVEYPTYWINDSNTSRTNAIVRVYCTFDGQLTEETKRVAKYTNQIRDLQEEIDRLSLQLEILKQENRELTDAALSRAKKQREIYDALRGGDKNDTNQNPYAALTGGHDDNM